MINRDVTAHGIHRSHVLAPISRELFYIKDLLDRHLDKFVIRPLSGALCELFRGELVMARIRFIVLSVELEPFLVTAFLEDLSKLGVGARMAVRVETSHCRLNLFVEPVIEVEHSEVGDFALWFSENTREISTAPLRYC